MRVVRHSHSLTACVISIPKGTEREKNDRGNAWINIGWQFSKWVKEINSQTQDSKWLPSKIKTKKNLPRELIIKSKINTRKGKEEKQKGRNRDREKIHKKETT